MSAPTSQSQNTNNSGLNFLANVAANVDFVGEVIFWDKNLNRSRDEEKDPSPVARETGVAFVQEESSENTGSNHLGRCLVSYSKKTGGLMWLLKSCRTCV